MNQIALHLPPAVPYGLCHCGCGKKTRIAPKTAVKHGYIAGEPRPYVFNHAKRGIIWDNGRKLRRCSTCHQIKPLKDFPQRKDKPFHISKCLFCYRKHDAAWRKKYRSTRKRGEEIKRLKKAYGITIEQYENLLAAQGGKCAICDTSKNPKRSSHYGIFDVDHCHDTGKVRGLLCGSCNRGIGQLRHDVKILHKAIAYLSN